ncbi:MAG: hypothetical protein J6K50_03095, partial [Clostridia bacterium]|nr:hypothetical protein [Clostridia bacterium]
EEIENNVYSFSEIAGYEILDPYGKDIDCYRYVFELLSGGMSALTDKILPLSVRKKYVEKPKTPPKTAPKKRTSTTAKGKKKTTKTTKTATKTTKKSGKTAKRR